MQYNNKKNNNDDGGAQQYLPCPSLVVEYQSWMTETSFRESCIVKVYGQPEEPKKKSIWAKIGGVTRQVLIPVITEVLSELVKHLFKL